MTRLAAVILGLAVLSATAHGEGGDQVTLYTPAFEGPDALGTSVATILNLKIWQTLRSAPAPNPHGLSFGSGVVVWGNTLTRYSHEAAADAAKDKRLLAQFVLWGKVYEYGDGAVVQVHLSAPTYSDFRQEHPEIWEIRIARPGDDVVFKADIPQRRYSFEPIVLAKDVIARYRRPDGLELHPTRDSSAVTGTVGGKVVALEQGAGMVKVRSDGGTGWVRLPELANVRSEVVDFVGGIIRVFRGDWEGAEALMHDVTSNPHAPNDLKTDALLYQGFATARQGHSPAALFARARELSPNARRVVVYAVMGQLADYRQALASGADGAKRETFLASIRHDLDGSRALFLDEDPWLVQTRNGLDRLERGH
jgi:hypothetical protein